MREAAREWLLSAEMDLAVCARLIDDDDLTPMLAFHAQQCIEKLLKASLEESQQPVPRSHDLVRLNQLVKEGVTKTLDLDQDLLEELSTIYMDARYPSDLGLLPSGKPSLPEAHRYYESALHLRDQLGENLEFGRECRFVIRNPKNLTTKNTKFHREKTKQKTNPPPIFSKLSFAKK